MTKNKMQIGVDPNNLHWAEDTSRFGFKMLQKMGWKEGSGLGKNGEGLSEHIKIVKRQENLGLGANKSNASTVCVKTVAFSEVLRKLNEQQQEPASQNSNSDDDNNESQKEKKKTNRVHHHRRAIRATKRWEGADLAAILGQRANSGSVWPITNNNNNNNSNNHDDSDDQNLVETSSNEASTPMTPKLQDTFEQQDDETSKRKTVLDLTSMTRKELKSLKKQLKSDSISEKSPLSGLGKKELKQLKKDIKKELKKQKGSDNKDTSRSSKKRRREGKEDLEVEEKKRKRE